MTFEEYVSAHNARIGDEFEPATWKRAVEMLGQRAELNPKHCILLLLSYRSSLRYRAINIIRRNKYLPLGTVQYYTQ